MKKIIEIIIFRIYKIRTGKYIKPVLLNGINLTFCAKNVNIIEETCEIQYIKKGVLQ